MTRTFPVAWAPSVSSTRWAQLDPEPTWADFLLWLDLDRPASRKDCGGYVAGQLIGERRGKDTVLSRSMLTLDADSAGPTFVLDLELTLPGVAGLVHTTWSHRVDAPRYRVDLPLSRDVTPDEYRLLYRAISEEVGTEFFDVGSGQPERLMYRPSAPGGAEVYRYVLLAGSPLDVEWWLSRALEAGEPSAGGPVVAIDYDGPAYGDLSSGERELADSYVAGEVAWWRSAWEVAAGWDDGVRDGKGRGWEALARDFAWALARIAAHPWSGLGVDAAGELYDLVVPDEVTSAVGVKWGGDALVVAAGRSGIGDPPWRPGDFTPVVSRTVDVTSTAAALTWLQAELGVGGLAGMFSRRGELVHTPRVGEEGYVPPRNPSDNDGPTQVRRVPALGIAARVDTCYLVTKTTGRRARPVRVLFPAEVAARSMMTLEHCSGLRPLEGITHTPTVRGDGSVLDVPGYDAASGMLYLPTAGADGVGYVPERPSADDVAQAGKWLLDMTADFPWSSGHDRANYLAALMTPLLRKVVPPPYKMVVINAPQRGSGKSLLAGLMRIVHGGVFKSEFPRAGDEQRKTITALLDTTSAPVVQFDNVAGVLKSSILDGMLTSDVWVDRILGASESVELSNDRLWVVTGNNVQIGGDLVRRVLWITINAKMEHPEERMDFLIPDLEQWAKAHRGELLRALLVLVRAWVVAGRPGEKVTTDSFSSWVAVTRGILEVADLGDAVGVVDHVGSRVVNADQDEDEWTTFLAACWRVMESRPWTVRELVEHVGWDQDEAIREDELPGDLAEKWARGRAGLIRSLGQWLLNRNQRWSGGYSVEKQRMGRDHTLRWKVIHVTDSYT